MPFISSFKNIYRLPKNRKVVKKRYWKYASKNLVFVFIYVPKHRSVYILQIGKYLLNLYYAFNFLSPPNV